MTHKTSRFRSLALRVGAGLVLFTVIGVWVTHEFPGLTSTPKTSIELLGDVFRAPAGAIKGGLAYVRRRASIEAVVLFVRAAGVADDVEGRLVRMVRGEDFTDVTVPFVFYLYELYGDSLQAAPEDVASLAYEEPPEAHADAAPPSLKGLAPLVRRSPRLRQHVARALTLFDALFLRMRPEARGKDLPVHERYDEAAYAVIRGIVRQAAQDFLLRAEDEVRPGTARNEYLAALETLVRDDERLADLVEFFSDFIRNISDQWLDAYVRREKRKEERLAWVEAQIAANRYDLLADYAAGRARRRLVFHLTVDGLQGKLLEGLAQLSSGDRASPGARYVIDLVRVHERPEMQPARYGSKLAPGLGQDVVTLARDAPDWPDYLETFKRQVFSPSAEAVVVNVATVDTPSISVRNLPIAFSGHGVSGPFGTGIPNFSYLDRRTGRGWYFWGSDALHLRDIFANREERIPRGVKRPEGRGARSLFERLWRLNTLSCMSSTDDGALEKVSAEVGLAVGEFKRNFIEKTMVLRFRQRAAMERELNRRRLWLAEHRGLSDSFLGSLLFRAPAIGTFREHARYLAEHEDEGLPDYALWYNPWPDHFAHSAGPYSDAIVGRRGEYDRLDFYLGRVIEAYASVPAADGRGSYADRTLFGVVSDHGLIYTPRLVSTDEALFGAMRREDVRVTWQKLTHDEGGLPAIHGRERIKPTRPFDAIVGSTAGGSWVLDLFEVAGLRGDDAAWRRHPDYHALRRHALLSGQVVDWIELSKRHLADTMDLALVREHGPRLGAQWPAEVESAVRVFTPGRGESRILRLRGAGGQRAYRYEVLDDKDPLNLLGSIREELLPEGGPSAEEVRATLARCLAAVAGCDDRTWQETLSATSRPDVVHQFSHLYDSDRAGTVNVFPVLHVGMNSGVAGRHAGEAFGERNGTALFWGAGLGRARLQTARNGSVPVTLYHYLAGDEAFHAPEPGSGVAPADQFGYPTLMEETAFAPLR